MHNITKRSIALTFLIISGSSISANSCIKPIAMVATAGIAGYFIGPWLYSYLFQLSDVQEMEEAIHKVKNAEILYNDISFTYHNELAIVTAYTTDILVVKQLKFEIMAKYSKYPFYNYIKNLNLQMQKIKEVVTELSSKRIAIAERKLKLYSDSSLTATQLSVLQEGYDSVISSIKNSLNNVDDLHKKLATIRSLIIQSNDYILEAQQIRIAELESRLYTSDYYTCSHDYNSWSYPSQTVYVTTPAQPQVNVTYCDSWSRPSETVYVSAPSQSSPVTVNNYNTVSSPSYSQSNTNASSSTTSTSSSYASSSAQPSDNSTITYQEPTMVYDSDLWCDRTDPFNS